MSKFRIKEKEYDNHTEYWVEKAVTLFGFTLWWSRTTISYFSKFEHAAKHLADKHCDTQITSYY